MTDDKDKNAVPDWAIDCALRINCYNKSITATNFRENVRDGVASIIIERAAIITGHANTRVAELVIERDRWKLLAKNDAAALRAELEAAQGLTEFFNYCPTCGLKLENPSHFEGFVCPESETTTSPPEAVTVLDMANQIVEISQCVQDEMPKPEAVTGIDAWHVANQIMYYLHGLSPETNHFVTKTIGMTYDKLIAGFIDIVTDATENAHPTRPLNVEAVAKEMVKQEGTTTEDYDSADGKVWYNLDLAANSVGELIEALAQALTAAIEQGENNGR